MAVELISRADPGLISDATGGGSLTPASISADGRYVAFSNSASNLVPTTDGSGLTQVYRYDRLTGEVLLVSVSVDGASGGNSFCTDPVISADGRVIAFRSSATNLHVLATDFGNDIFARDLSTGTTYLVSVNHTGTAGGNGFVAGKPVISSDGTIIAFESSSSDLHPLDTNAFTDVFARDLSTGTTHLVSINSAGTGSGNFNSVSPVISGDGRVVAYESQATDLHPLDVTPHDDIFARNLSLGTTELVSRDRSAAGGGNDVSDSPVISSSGNVIAFMSRASNLHPLDANATKDIFARDLTSGITHLVTVNTTGTGGGDRNALGRPGISADGRRVVFCHWATNIHPLTTDGLSSVFLRDLATGDTQLVSANSTQTVADNGYSFDAVISADGKVIAFESAANNLFDGDTDGLVDEYVRVLEEPSSRLITRRDSSMPSVSGGGRSAFDRSSISSNGRYIAFVSEAPNLLAEMKIAPIIQQVYRYDRYTGEMVLVSVNRDGTSGANAHASNPVISGDGAVIVFESRATNLHALDTSTNFDIFARDLSTGETTLVSVNSAGTGSGGFDSVKPVISQNGRVVAFESGDIFARDLAAGVTHLVSVNTAGTGGGNQASDSPSISADGAVVAFRSRASNLHALDMNTLYDVFARNLLTGITHLVSVNRTGTGSGNQDSAAPVISAEGAVVAFASDSSNLHALDTNSTTDVSVRDLPNGATHLVSVNSAGTGSGDHESFNPVINADGSTVAFLSRAANLHGLDTNVQVDVFARQLTQGITHLVSVNRFGTGPGTIPSLNPAISGDGTLVAFEGGSNNLHPLETSPSFDKNVYVRDLSSNTTSLISVNVGGTAGGGFSDAPVVSADGGAIVFRSGASDLVINDYSSQDVFAVQLRSIRDLNLRVDRNWTAAMPGDSLTYSLHYENAGNQDATDVVITQMLPEGTAFEPASSTAGWTETSPGSGVFKFVIDAIARGGKGSVMFAVNVDNPVAASQSRIISTATISDEAGAADANPADNTATDTTNLAVNSIVIGADAGAAQEVRVLDAGTLQERAGFAAYSQSFPGGVRVAMGDINGDGVHDIITAPGKGHAPEIRVFDGVTGQQLPGTMGSFFAYSPLFTGVVYVASGDVNGDGRDDIITAPGSGGGPQVRVFSGVDGSRLMQFLAYDRTFVGGVTVAAGDIDGDGLDDVITGPAKGAQPVKVFAGEDGAQLRSFFPYGALFAGGVYVASGDVNADGRDALITGAGRGGGPQVRVFDGETGARLATFFAFDKKFTGGVRVASADVNGDGHDDLVVGAGPGGGPQVKTFSGANFGKLNTFFAYPKTFTGGVFVAGAPHGADGAALRLADNRQTQMSATEVLDDDQLDLIRAAAIGHWQSAGLPADALNELRAVHFIVADLPGNQLGFARGDSIQIDHNAGGRGWFVDRTPFEDEPFSTRQVDLLTAVLHEMGHVLGLDHVDRSGTETDLMLDELSPGIRRLPIQSLVDAMFAGW